MRLVPLLLLLSGCVTTGAYNSKVSELERGRRDAETAAGLREAALKSQLKAAEQDKADLDKLRADLDQRLKAALAERDDLQRRLDDTTALSETLKGRLVKLGQNVDKLTSEKGQLAQTLDEAKARLEDLRKQKLAAEARAATFRQLMEKLRAMIDAGQLKVVIRDGRMLIALPNDVLFESGKTAINPAGRTALAKVAEVLAGIPDRHYLVAGHTDNVPIHSKAFASNWELSTQRAVEVTLFLIQNGLSPQVLAAAGYGEFDPIATNDTPEHKAQNRRIEIVLQPNLSDLPSLDALQPKK